MENLGNNWKFPKLDFFLFFTEYFKMFQLLEDFQSNIKYNILYYYFEKFQNIS